MEDRKITITTPNGEEVVLNVLFTYHYKEKNMDFVFMFEDENDDEVIVFQYFEDSTISSVEDEEILDHLNDVLDAYLDDTHINEK